MWFPTLQPSPTPRYLALAEAIETDIAGGRLKGGDQLPTHRDLARQLKVTIGTITRGYREAQKRGLITGEVGRGSFVREQSARSVRLTWDREDAGSGAIELSQNFPVPLPEIEQRVLAPIVRDLAGDMPSVISAPWPALLSHHQHIGLRWLERYGVTATPRRVLISTGFQSALWAIVSALCNAGDAILADQLTTPGLLTLAGALNVRVAGVAGDEHGMLPAALERAIDEHEPRLLYLTPTIHTPTTTVMPAARRRDIAAIAARRGLRIIEDDDNWPLLDDRGPGAAGLPTFTSLADDRTFLIADVSRALGLGLRLSYVLCPEASLDETAGALTGTTWMPAPMVAEIVARLIEGGSAQTIIDARRVELAARHALAQQLLPANRIDSHTAGHHLWLRLPEEWRSESFAAAAQKRGVLVNAAATFAVNRAMSPGAVRICIGSPRTREELERGLRIIAGLLAQRPDHAGMVV